MTCWPFGRLRASGTPASGFGSNVVSQIAQKNWTRPEKRHDHIEWHEGAKEQQGKGWLRMSLHLGLNWLPYRPFTPRSHSCQASWHLSATQFQSVPQVCSIDQPNLPCWSSQYPCPANCVAVHTPFWMSDLSNRAANLERTEWYSTNAYAINRLTN